MIKENKKALQFFQSLADETRLRIVKNLLDGPKTVNEIHNKINEISLSAVSHQLKLLNNLNIVNYHKKGREKFFELSDEYCWCILRNKNHFKRGKCTVCAEHKNGQQSKEKRTLHMQ